MSYSSSQDILANLKYGRQFQLATTESGIRDLIKKPTLALLF